MTLPLYIHILPDAPGTRPALFLFHSAKKRLNSSRWTRFPDASRGIAIPLIPLNTSLPIKTITYTYDYKYKGG